MRLSPKSIFVGLIALGLPFAVTFGWTLGNPFTSDKPPSAATPGGSGAIGTAPVKDTTSPRPVWLPGRYEAGTPARAATAAPSAPPVAPEIASPSSPATASPGGPLVTVTTLPPLTDPPVPTPTMVTSEPPPPTATPSSDPPSSSGGGIGAGLLRRH